MLAVTFSPQVYLVVFFVSFVSFQLMLRSMAGISREAFIIQQQQSTVLSYKILKVAVFCLVCCRRAVSHSRDSYAGEAASGAVFIRARSDRP